MKTRIVLVGATLVILVMVSYLVWGYMNYQDYLSKTVHGTDRWAVIMDSKGDIIAIETTSDEVWDKLVELYENKDERWIGGIVGEYENKWGFRFNPETIIIAQVTIEGAQSNIQGISGDLDYWINTWANVAYVLAKVTEIHK